MKPQSSKEPTKKQRRALEVLQLQFPTLHWNFARFSNTIYTICPGRSYKIAPDGKISLIHRNHIRSL